MWWGQGIKIYTSKAMSAHPGSSLGWVTDRLAGLRLGGNGVESEGGVCRKNITMCVLNGRLNQTDLDKRSWGSSPFSP